MKDQYFGDVNDYRKYGLLRCVAAASSLRLCVAWMLTPNDGSTDGKFLSYLDNPPKWVSHDPALFNGLSGFLAGQDRRGVHLIERSNLLPSTNYFSALIPDYAGDRQRWFAELLDMTHGEDFVFLDPDNGIEIKSRPYGTKASCKFVYWHEIEKLWASGKSLLVYQHFIREKRAAFIQRMLHALHEATPKSLVEAFSTAHVVFLMALQPEHQQFHQPIVSKVREGWKGQINHWDLADA